MNKELPSVYQSIYYVYTHTDPETEEVIYVGKGSRGRAWHCAETNSRGYTHAQHLNTLTLQGYTPDSWVTIIASGLTSEEAYKLETDLIWSLEPFPKYNDKKDSCCVLDNAKLILISKLRDEGLSYASIANEIEVATMTVYRALNGHTKNYT